VGTRYRKYSSRNTCFLRLNIGPFKLVLCKDLLRSVQLALVKTRSVQKNILRDNSSCTNLVPLLSRVFHGVSTSITWRLQLNVEVWDWYNQFIWIQTTILASRFICSLFTPWNIQNLAVLQSSFQVDVRIRQNSSLVRYFHSSFVMVWNILTYIGMYEQRNAYQSWRCVVAFPILHPYSWQDLGMLGLSPSQGCKFNKKDIVKIIRFLLEGIYTLQDAIGG